MNKPVVIRHDFDTDETYASRCELFDLMWDYDGVSSEPVDTSACEAEATGPAPVSHPKLTPG